MTNYFMIEKSRSVNKVLSMAVAGLDVAVTLDQDRSTNEGHFFEVTFTDPADYQMILDRLTNLYMFN